MGALISLALTIAPELAKWLFGEGAEGTTTAVSKAVEAATGTSDPEAAKAMLQQSPAAANQLRVQLAQIAADSEQTARAADLEHLAATLRSISDPGLQAVALAGQSTLCSWSAPIISAVVLLTFGLTMAVVMLHGTPPGSETAANMLLGTLAAMATSVVSYWVGSSAGSARKDDRLAQAGK